VVPNHEPGLALYQAAGMARKEATLDQRLAKLPAGTVDDLHVLLTLLKILLKRPGRWLIMVHQGHIVKVAFVEPDQTVGKLVPDNLLCLPEDGHIMKAD